MNYDSLKAHLEELVKKHRKLDEDIIELGQHRNVQEDIRRLKTQKLFYKDEIHRINSQIKNSGTGTNGPY